MRLKPPRCRGSLVRIAAQTDLANQILAFYFVEFLDWIVFVALGCREQLSPVLKHTNMKSRITIEVDFEKNNQPVIQILHTDSDDVRDRLIKNFCEQNGSSSWCNLRYVTGTSDMTTGISRIFITPISPEHLKEEAEIMLEQFRLNESWLQNHVDEIQKEQK